MSTLLLTGSTSDIGAEVAIAAPEHGFNRVILHYAKAKDKAEQLKKEIETKGAKAELIQCDFLYTKSIETFQHYIQDGQHIDAFVHAPAHTALRKPLDDYTNDEIEQSLVVNLLSTLKVLKSVAHKMKAQNSGNIVLFSSQAGAFGGNKIVPYAAAKGAINTIIMGLARELAPYDIRVNGVSPGIIDTKGQTNDLSKVIQTIPLGRAGTPQDITEAVYWLLSDKSTYVTGTILPIAGGR